MHHCRLRKAKDHYTDKSGDSQESQTEHNVAEYDMDNVVDLPSDVSSDEDSVPDTENAAGGSNNDRDNNEHANDPSNQQPESVNLNGDNSLSMWKETLEYHTQQKCWDEQERQPKKIRTGTTWSTLSQLASLAQQGQLTFHRLTHYRLNHWIGWNNHLTDSTMMYLLQRMCHLNRLNSLKSGTGRNMEFLIK